MFAQKHEGMYQPPMGSPCWHTVADAAKAMGASEGTVRKHCREAGVRKIAGRATAGMVELVHNGRRGYLPYFE